MSLKSTFDDQGFAVVEDVLSDELRHALIDDYSALLDRLAHRFYAEGRLPSAFADLPFEQRLAAVLSESQENLFQYFDISFPHGDLSDDSPIHLSPAVFDLIRSPRLLDAVETLISGEIYSNPIQHIRIKPPQAIAERNRNQSTLVSKTGWHQDQGVAREESDQTELLTCWIAITDATVQNGCLQVIPYSHRQGLTIHCPTNEMTIPDKLLGGEPHPVEIKAGSALFLHRLTKHASLPNVSAGIRWSFDLRYQPIGQPTGRDELPGFVVRSRQNPASEQHDFATWRNQWEAARQAIIAKGKRQKSHRWDGDAPVCA